MVGLAGFQYEDERGAEPGSTYYTPVSRTNYFIPLAVHGDFKNRFFYTLGGSIEHYSLFGLQTSPRAGLNYYVLRPRSGVFSGTRILFNFGEAVREPKLTDQDDSLYNFLATYNPSAIPSLHKHSSWRTIALPRTIPVFTTTSEWLMQRPAKLCWLAGNWKRR